MASKVNETTIKTKEKRINFLKEYLERNKRYMDDKEKSEIKEDIDTLERDVSKLKENK